ncbi:Cytochrome P450 6B2, partial [Melipona quadrifasciata]
FCYYSTSAFGFWKNRGIPGPKPVFFFGNSLDILFSRFSAAEYVHKLFPEFKDDPMFGLYMRRSAILVVKDPELLRDVMVRDFSTFSERGFIAYERVRHVAFLTCKLISSICYFHFSVLPIREFYLHYRIPVFLHTFCPYL